MELNRFERIIVKCERSFGRIITILSRVIGYGLIVYIVYELMHHTPITQLTHYIMASAVLILMARYRKKHYK